MRNVAFVIRGSLYAAVLSAVGIGTVAYSAETVQYGYDTQGRLSTVTNTDGTTRTYLYENASFPNALTGVIDESGNRYSTWSYDSQGRATGTEEAGGAGAVSLVYNTDGTVTTTDALGAVRTFSFGRYGDRNLVTGISGSQCPTCQEGLATTYDLRGFVSSRTDYNGNVTQYTYDDDRGLELSRTEAYGTAQARTITTSWHATYHLPLSVSIYNGNSASGTPIQTTTYTYDSSGNQLTKTVTDPTTSASRIWTYTYDTYGRVLTADGPRTDVSDVTTYTWYTCTTGYECGELHTITDALGHVTTYTSYNAAGQPLSITDANGVITTLTYDARQRLTARAVGNEATSFDYWPTGLLKKVTLPDGSYLSYVYDAAHRLTEIDDANGNKVVYTLDAMGNHLAENLYDPSNALASTHSRIFNSLSQLWKDVPSSGSSAETTIFGYDNNGNQTTINAPLTRDSSNSYDALNRLAQVTDPQSGITHYGYDANDNLISVTDPRSLTTSYQYDGLGNLLQQASPDTGVTNNTYDAAGNLKTSTDARNKTATYSYDELNRITQVTYPDQTITYGYDQGTNGVGRLTSATDASGSTGWTYTTQGRIHSKTQTVGSVSKAVSYDYNTAGQLTTLTTPAGRVITYGYTNNQVSSITIGTTLLLNTVTYEPFGPVSGWSWGNGAVAIRSYDQDGRVSQIESAGLKTYTYDEASRITGIADVDDGTQSFTYGYDTLDRLTAANKTNLAQSFSYDANGNRLTQGGTQTISYTNSTTSNRLNSTSGDLARTYSYDDAGHVVSYGNLSFTYNAAGRMTSASNGSDTTSYAINALGQRVRKSNASGTTYFLYDEAGHLIGEYDQNGDVIQEIVWLNDTPVASVRWGSCGVAIFYIHTDHLNTPRKITKRSSNEVVWRWDGDPFGTTTANKDPEGLGDFVFNLRYPGQYYDQETGLNYNVFRDYDSATGRYVESDPLGLYAGINTFAYAYGSPLKYIDLYGLLCGDWTEIYRKTSSTLDRRRSYLGEFNWWEVVLDGHLSFGDSLDPTSVLTKSLPVKPDVGIPTYWYYSKLSEFQVQNYMRFWDEVELSRPCVETYEECGQTKTRSWTERTRKNYARDELNYDIGEPYIEFDTRHIGDAIRHVLP